MSGTGPGDESMILIASFVEEVKPFFVGIRRGVFGIFAMPRDAQAITAARASLGTLAGSSRVLDFPAARQFAELAQLLGEAFEAAERGGVPDESQAPMLTMVAQLEEQLDGLETGDERGRERLDNAYHLLEQVLQTVEQAETAPPPVFEIGLDDLLLTLMPAAPQPQPEPPVMEIAPPPFVPEPTHTELVLLSADDVAPIEWGEKEAILWNKGGWDDKKTAYGNTEWVFLDEEEVATVVPAAPATDLVVALNAPADDLVIELVATAPLLGQGRSATDAAAAADAPAVPPAPAEHAASDDEPTASATEQPDTLLAVAPLGLVAEAALPIELIEAGTTGKLPTAPTETDATDEVLVASADAGTTGTLPPAPTDAALASVTGTTPLDAQALEEAALLDLTPDDLLTYLALSDTAQRAFLQTRLSEMADFATDLGIAVAPEAVARRDTGDLSTLLGTPVSDTGNLPLSAAATARLFAATDALITPASLRPPKAKRRNRRVLPGSEAAGTDRLLDGRATVQLADQDANQDASAAADTIGQPDVPPPAAATAQDQILHVATATDDADPAIAAAMDDAAAQDEHVAAVDDLLLAEHRHTERVTGPIARGHGTADLADVPAESDAIPNVASADSADSADDDEQADDSGFLDALLDDEPGLAPRSQHHLVEASDALFADEDDDDLDPNFAAMPDVSPEIEAAFARLSEADINTFLTLDGDAALVFLQERAAGEATPPEGADAVLVALPVAEATSAADEFLPGGGAGDVATLHTSLSDLSLDQEILEVFLQEAQELLTEWERASVLLRRAPTDLAVMTDLRRTAHTLKGAANMMGFSMLGAAGRRVEHLLDLLDERELSVPPAVLDFIDRTFALVRRLSADATANPHAFTAESAALELHSGDLAAEIERGTPISPERRDDMDLPTPSFALSGVDRDFARDEPDELVDDELMDVFVQEAEDHLGGFNRALVALDRRPDDGAQLAEAKRVIHTLKGAAAALGYPVTAALCHSIEDLFGVLDDSRREPSRDMLTLFFESAEALEALVAGITAGRGERAGQADALRARYAAFLSSTGSAGGAGSAGTTDTGANQQQAEPPPTLEDFARTAEHAPRSVRVDIAHLDNLLNLVGELVINRTGQEQHLEKLGRTVAELLLSVERLRRVGFQLENRYEVAELLRGEAPRAALSATRRATQTGLTDGRDPGTGRPYLTLVGPLTPGEEEFDALELDRYTELHTISRELVEIAADISAAGTELDGLYDGFDQTLSRQSRIATDLQDRMMEVRLVPLSTIAARLYRAVRGVATRRGRLTELVITGETVEIDKVLLEEITDPLLHLVRNAADHGIESPEERRQRGKPASGTIHLSASREGNEAVIRVHDDGAGIDLERILDKALARGIIRRRDGLTREQVLDLIFLPGFSTSAVISDISGRGVGLDVVRTNVSRLKGVIDVASTLGVGTTFTIRLPIMLAVTRALLVRSGTQTFAIPLPVVEQVAFFRKELVSTVGGAELFDLDGVTYPILHLNRALGLANGGEIAAGARALIVGNAERRVALIVDELVGQQEIVVKRLGRHLQSVAGVAGATILGSGQIILILNVLDLVGAQRAGRVGEAQQLAPLPLHPPVAPTTPRGGDGSRVAMVVDDSLSVRRVLTRTLERDGWQVLGAKDGVEALEMLAWARPQVLVLDIEMPRMDGYELANLLRNGVEHRDLPIAMLTSRAGEKHRRKALELGVSAYLVKPFEEAELLRTVRELSATVRRQTVG